MYFNTAFLIMVNVWHTKDFRHIPSDWLRKFVVDDPHISLLTTNTSKEIWISATPVHTIAPLLPDFWQDKITATHLVDGDGIDEYTITTGFFEIRPTAIPSLAKMNGVGYSKALDELSEKALPTFSGELAHSSHTRKHSISILYLELDETLTAGLSIADASACLMAEALRHRLSQAGSIILPNFVNGMLIMHGIGIPSPQVEALAVNLSRQPSKSEVGSLTLPDTVMELRDHMVCAHIYRHLGVRLTRLPLYKNNATQYLNLLSTNKGNSLAKGSSGWSDVFSHLSSAYELRFLEDRQSVMTERLSITQCANAISENLDSNIFSKLEKFPLLDTGTSSSFPYTYDFLSSVKNDFKNAVKDMGGKEKLIITREAFLSDYLRDISLAATTRSNLKLQQSIRRLTFVAVVIALATLILTLWPEGIKTIMREITSRIFSVAG
ncbi:MAG: hypothetical protein ABR554_06760 [Pyrinomonadaceae bacterium]